MKLDRAIWFVCFVAWLIWFNPLHAATAFRTPKGVIVVGKNLHKIGGVIVAGDTGANPLDLSGIKAADLLKNDADILRQRAIAAYPVKRYQDQRFFRDEMAKYSAFVYEHGLPYCYRITVIQDLGPIHRTMARLERGQLTGLPAPEDGIYKDSSYWTEKGISQRKARHLVAVKGAQSVAIRAQR